MSVAVLLFAVLLAPTEFRFIRESYLGPWGVVTPADFVGGLILLVVMARMATLRRPFEALPKYLLVSFWGLATVLILSLTYTPDLSYGADKVRAFLTLAGVPCLAAPFVLRTMRDLRGLLKALVVLAIGATGVLVATRPYANSVEFATVLGSNYLLIQHLCGMGVLILLYNRVLQAKGLSWKLIWLCSVTPFLWAVLYTGGKGPVFALLGVTMLMPLLVMGMGAAPRGWALRIQLLVIPVVVVMLDLLVLGVFLYLYDFSAFVWRIAFFLSDDHYSRVERAENAAAALGLFGDNPTLGVGIGGFRRHAPSIGEFEAFTYPHNIALEVLAELGTIGFVAFVGLLVGAFRAVVQASHDMREEAIAPVFLSLLLFSLFNALTSQDLANRTLFGFVGASHALRRAASRPEGDAGE